MTRTTTALTLLLVVAGCGSEAPSPVAVPQELSLRWQTLSHRISQLEIAFTPSPDGKGGVVVAQDDGGPWGALDSVQATVGLDVWRSNELRAVTGSLLLAIEPGAEAEGEPYGAAGTLALAAGELADATALAAFVTGFRVDTNEYATPPAFDPPYDPGDGFTSQGLGIGLGEPALAGDVVTVAVRASNRLGACDRADMNAAIPLATTWVRVDVLVVGARGAGSRVVRGETSYTVSSPVYDEVSEVPHAAADAQRIAFAGSPGVPTALFGLTGFDVWANVDGHHEPACVVQQDPINSWGEAVSGPGRYVRELGVRLGSTAYDAASGTGAAAVDVYLSNDSEVYEEGNLCLGLRGAAAMLQLDDPSAERTRLPAVGVHFGSGERPEVPVDLGASE